MADGRSSRLDLLVAQLSIEIELLVAKKVKEIGERLGYIVEIHSLICIRLFSFNFPLKYTKKKKRKWGLQGATDLVLPINVDPIGKREMALFEYVYKILSALISNLVFCFGVLSNSNCRLIS